MKRIIKASLSLLLAFVAVLSLAACGKKEEVVKIGLNGIESAQWEYVAEQLKDEGITLELVYFADYVQPNRALVDGEIQLNAFQTVAFLKAFNAENNNAIGVVGTTVLAPMGLYSKKIKSISEITDGAQVTVPNDISNQGRALILLEEAGLIKLKEGAGLYSTPDDIVSNPKNLDIKPIQAGQIPPTLDDVQFAVINNGVAVNAGYALTDAIFVESETAKPYVNVIACKAGEEDNKTYKRIVELYQTPEVEKIIAEEYKGNSIPLYLPISELDYKG